MTLIELFGLLRKKLGLVITLPIVCAVVMAIVAWGVMPNRYTASVTMYVLAQGSSGNTTTSDTVTTTDLTASQMLANDFAQLAKSNRVLDGTASDLGMTSLDGYDVSVTSSSTTRVITLSVTGQSPAAVMTVANQMATEISSTAVEIMNVQSVNVIDSAKQPTDPSGPPRALYTAIAFLIGLLLAIVIVVVADMADTTIKSKEDAEKTLGLPILGVMPKVKVR